VRCGLFHATQFPRRSTVFADEPRTVPHRVFQTPPWHLPRRNHRHPPSYIICHASRRTTKCDPPPSGRFSKIPRRTCNQEVLLPTCVASAFRGCSPQARLHERLGRPRFPLVLDRRPKTGEQVGDVVCPSDRVAATYSSGLTNAKTKPFTPHGGADPFFGIRLPGSAAAATHRAAY